MINKELIYTYVSLQILLHCFYFSKYIFFFCFVCLILYFVFFFLLYLSLESLYGKRTFYNDGNLSGSNVDDWRFWNAYKFRSTFKHSTNL